MTPDFNQDVLTIADATPADFATVFASLEKPESSNREEFVLAFRDAVMEAFDETTPTFNATKLADEHLPELFDCLDALAERLMP